MLPLTMPEPIKFRWRLSLAAGLALTMVSGFILAPAAADAQVDMGYGFCPLHKLNYKGSGCPKCAASGAGMTKSATGSSPAGAPAGNTPGLGLNAQQQLALAAAQAALPLVQQTLRNIFSGPAQRSMPAPSQNQSAIAAQQLYNTGLWYLRHHDYANAQIEFEKALGRDHGNRAILNSLEETKRKMAQAQQAALQAAPPATPVPPAKLTAAPSALNFITLNNDPQVVDLSAPAQASSQTTTAAGSSGPIPAPRAGPVPSASANPANSSSMAQLQQQSLNADFDQIFSDPTLKVPSPK